MDETKEAAASTPEEEAVELAGVGALRHDTPLLAQRLQGRASSHRVRARRHGTQASAVRVRLAKRRTLCRSSLEGAAGWGVPRDSARPKTFVGRFDIQADSHRNGRSGSHPAYI